MPRLRLWIAGVLIALAPTHTLLHAETHFFQTLVAARGGCGAINTLNIFGVRSDVEHKLYFGETDVKLFGKPVLDWSDDDIAAAIRTYKDCWVKLEAGETRGGRIKAPGIAPFAQGQIRQFETILPALVMKARNVDNLNKAQQNARIELEKAPSKAGA